MLELKQRFEELETLPTPDLQLRIQARVQRLQQTDHLVSNAEQAWHRPKSPWARQLLAAAAVIVFALGLGIALLHARSRAPVQVHPSPSTAPQPLPTPTITGVNPREFYPGSLHMLSPTVGWDGYGYYQTNDGGLRWRMTSSGTALANEIKGGASSFALDATHAWVTGATINGLVVSRTLDGGRTWSVSAPLPPTVRELRGGNAAVQLDFIDVQHGWLVVDTASSASPNSRSILATSDGGRRWNQIASASESDRSILGRLAAGCTPSGITFISADSGWLTFDCSRANGPLSAHSGPVAAVTHDAGRSWDAVSLPSYPSEPGYFSASPPIFTQNNGILPVFFGGVVGSSTVIYGTADAGRTWSFHRLPFWTRQLDFVDAHTGWAVKALAPTQPSPNANCYVITCHFSAELYGTGDGGITWRLLSRLVGADSDLGFFNARVGYYRWSASMMPTAPGGVMKSTDGGRTWAMVHPVLEGQP